MNIIVSSEIIFHHTSITISKVGLSSPFSKIGLNQFLQISVLAYHRSTIRLPNGLLKCANLHLQQDQKNAVQKYLISLHDGKCLNFFNAICILRNINFWGHGFTIEYISCKSVEIRHDICSKC